MNSQQQPRATLALVGPTGLVGQVVLDVLATRPDAWERIILLDHDRFVGSRELVAGEEREVEGLHSEAFVDADVAIFATPADVSAKWVPFATASGCAVVDCSDAFRQHPEVPMVVPEINAEAVQRRPMGIVASPSGPSLIMLPVLHTLHERWTIKTVTVTSMQAVTGAGRSGADRLYAEVGALAGHPRVGQLPGDVRRYVADLPDDSPFLAPIVSNIIPWIGGPAGPGSSEDDGLRGWSSEEIGIRDELRHVLGDPELQVAATCVQVPIVTTHMSSVHLRFENRVNVAEARQAIVEDTNGAILLFDEHGADWPTPVDAVGTEPIWVGRFRQAQGQRAQLDFVVCGDNIRKGSALNAVQIAELIIGVRQPTREGTPQ